MARKHNDKALPKHCPIPPTVTLSPDSRTAPPDYAVGKGPLPKSFFYKLDKHTSLPVGTTISDNQERVDKKRGR